MPRNLPSSVLVSDPAFNEFASREPFFAVITDSANLSDRITGEGRARFFAAGDAIVDALFRTVTLSLEPHFAPSAILEYGCGPGRLALPLARRSRQRGGTLTAVDRSPAMLEHAQRFAAAEGAENITFAQPRDVLDGVRRFDFVTCYLVLQRLEPGDGLDLVRALLATLLPGGVGVFQFPVHSEVPTATAVLRRVRESSPALNELVQRARGERARGPFVPSHVYSLNDVVKVFREEGFDATHLVFDDHGDLSSVIAFVLAPEARAVFGPTNAETQELVSGTAPEVIDVRDVIATHSIEALNDAAEQYFATLTSWEHHLAKPFASADEAPSLLADAAIVLRALELRPGLRVVDFGAGSGWLSRVLTQLGCSVVVLDVSETALAMAQALYERVPVTGDQPAPSFLRFDGRHIDLPDASVDRIVCFHAFHHTPNPDEVIAEFGRIVRPGGVVAFAEPGANHSRSAKSQFEMRNYRVVENDVDLHRISDVARRHAFTDVRVFAASGEPLELSLTEYDDLCRGGAMLDAWARDTRRHLRNVSNFKLVKHGAVLDSTSMQGLACVVHVSVPTVTVAAGTRAEVDVRVTNVGPATWRPAGAGVGGVSIGIRVFEPDGSLRLAEVTGRALTEPPRPIGSGEGVDVRLSLPSLPAGSYRVEIDCVASDVIWFAQAGSKPATFSLVVRPS